MKYLRRRFESYTDGDDSFPLFALFLIFFVDEFDTAAFNVLAPDIRKAFDLTSEAFGVLVVANLSIVLLAAIPLGYYGDRLPRRNLVLVGAVLAGLFSFATGVAPVLALLVVFRLGNGLGRLVNDSIHNSLLADYYKPNVRAQVFGIHRNAVNFGTIAGAALTGSVAALFGWRAAFVALIVPLLAVAVLARKLHDPVRGATDDPESALLAQSEAPVPFAEARRILFAVKTLKRQYAAWLFIGAGVIPLAFLLPQFLDEVFHLGPFARGLIGAGNAAATFLGLQWSSKRTAGWMAQGMGEPVKRAGLSLGLVGVGIAVLSACPLALFVPMAALTSFVAGIFYPPFYATQAFVSPARYAPCRSRSARSTSWPACGSCTSYRASPAFPTRRACAGDCWPRCRTGSSVDCCCAPRTSSSPTTPLVRSRNSATPLTCAGSVLMPKAPTRCWCAAASRWPTTRCKCCSASTWRFVAARSSRCSAPTAPGSRRCSRRSAAWSTRSVAQSCSRAATSPTPTACRPPASA